MNQRSYLFAAGLFVLVAGVAHGWRSHRWISNEAVANAVGQLEHIPRTVGRWVSEDQTLTDVEVTTGEIAGYVQRTYRHLDTGAVAHMLLVAGESGPIATHPPTACFTGRGFHVVRSPVIFKAEGGHYFHQADFRNAAVDSASLIRVYWAWSGNGLWEAAENPRLQYVGEPALYKLYFSEEWSPNGDEEVDAGAGRLLMQELLPMISGAIRRSPDTLRSGV